MKFYDTVRNFELKVLTSHAFLECLVSMDGQDVEIDIHKRSKRSNQMNRLLWAYHTILSHHLGYSKEEIHEIVKMKFLKREIINEKTGEVLEYLKSTAELTKSEFAELIEQYRQWSSQIFDCYLPEPLEQLNTDL